MATPIDDEKAIESPAGGADNTGARQEESSSPASDEDEEEAPDPVRLSILGGVLVVLICFWVWTIFHPPPRPTYNDIPGIDLSHLTQPQREQVLREANSMMCDCGEADCTFTVAECRHKDKTTCDESLKLAAQIVQKVTGKKPIFTQKMPPQMKGPGNLPGTSPKSKAAAPQDASKPSR